MTNRHGCKLGAVVLKVSVYKDYENGRLGLGVKVVAEKATLADLLEAWEPLADDDSVFKQYAQDNYSPCKGCRVNCCKQAYVIPDLVSLKKMSDYLRLSPLEFAIRYFDQEKLRLNLPRLRSSPCTFLVEDCCSVYPARTLICRFYLCTHILGETEELIYSIALAGMAATQLYLNGLGIIDLRAEVCGMSSYEACLRSLLDSSRETEGARAFLEAHDYSDIPLTVFNLGR